ncbi:MAG: anti-sigma factor domain-containing protein [Candidatus Methylomirabilales bacterium]
MTHDELRDLLALYAMNAVSPSDEMELRAHLGACGDCTAVVWEHLDTAGELALAAAPVPPPEYLRDRILSAAAATEQSEPAASVVSARGLRLRWLGLAAGLAAVALLLLTGTLSVVLAGRLGDRDRQIVRERQIVALVISPSTTAVSLVGAKDSPRASGRIFVPDQGSSAAVVIEGLADPGRRTYQLWRFDDGRPIPMETFRPDPSGGAVLLASVSRSQVEQGMAVTLEDVRRISPRGPVILSSD